MWTIEECNTFNFAYGVNVHCPVNLKMAPESLLVRCKFPQIYFFPNSYIFIITENHKKQNKPPTNCFFGSRL